MPKNVAMRHGKTHGKINDLPSVNPSKGKPSPQTQQGKKQGEMKQKNERLTVKTPKNGCDVQTLTNKAKIYD